MNLLENLRDRAQHLCMPGICKMPWAEVAVLFTRAADEIERLRAMIINLQEQLIERNAELIARNERALEQKRKELGHERCETCR